MLSALDADIGGQEDSAADQKGRAHSVFTNRAESSASFTGYSFANRKLLEMKVRGDRAHQAAE
jgi:hypothetical protein